MKTLKETTREKLLLSAANEFALHGFVKANIDEISVNAGYGKGTVYNYFENKLELFLAVVRKSINNLAIEMEENIKDISDPVERFKMAIKTDLTYIENNHDLFITVIKEAYTASRDKQDDFMDASLPIFNIYLKLIEEGIKAGCYSENTDPVSIAVIVMGMTENLSLTNKMLDNYFGSTDDIVEKIYNTLIFGIKERE